MDNHMNKLILLTLVFAYTVVAQELSFHPITSDGNDPQIDTLNDFFPLTVGNQWTYGYYFIDQDQSPGAVTLEYADSGSITEQLIGKSMFVDSTVWTVQETRVISLNHNYGVYSAPQTSVDTFALIESMHAQHRIYRRDDINQGTLTAFPFSFAIPDTERLNRFGFEDSSNQKVLSTKQWPGFCRFTFKKSVGLQSILATDGCTCLKSTDISAQLQSSSILGIVDQRQKPFTRDFQLFQNYPNPFNPSTTISFTLSKQSFVSLKLFDLIGREVATIVSEKLQPGRYSRRWTAFGVTSGLYFYRLQAGAFTESRKLILVK
jgi:Secretion system C-terminal sorting domain